jgi:hypothetical protein
MTNLVCRSVDPGGGPLAQFDLVDLRSPSSVHATQNSLPVSKVGLCPRLPEPDDLYLLTYPGDLDGGRKYSALWVLLIHRRMLCFSRWVIPGLAEGVTGWTAGQR